MSNDAIKTTTSRSVNLSGECNHMKTPTPTLGKI